MPQEKQLIFEIAGLTTSSMAFGAASEVPFVVGASPLACFSDLLSFVSLAVGSYMLRPISRFKSDFKAGPTMALASVSACFFPPLNYRICNRLPWLKTPWGVANNLEVTGKWWTNVGWSKVSIDLDFNFG